MRILPYSSAPAILMGLVSPAYAQAQSSMSLSALSTVVAQQQAHITEAFQSANQAQATAAAALPTASLSDTAFLLPSTTTAQTLTELLDTSLTAQQFGAHCDADGTDDAPAFQLMFNAAALSGQPMTYSGKCYLAETIMLGTAPGGLISLSPVGEGELDTNGQDLIKAMPPQGLAGSVVYKFDLERNEVRSLANTPNTGRFLYVDCTIYGNFCTKNRSTIAGNHLYDMAGAFYGSELSSFDIERNVSEHAITTGSENFIEVHGDVVGSTQTCSAGVYTEDNTVTGGTFEYLNGCVQGFTNRFNNLLLGFFGVFSNAPVGVEGINNLGNYLEAGAEGIYLPSVDGTQAIGNSFDPNTASNGGMNVNWHAVVLGDPNGGAPAQAAVVSDNYVFNFSGQVVNTPFVVNAGNSSAMHHNTVTGLINTAHCMLAGTAVGTSYAAPVLTMDHNTCWAAGDMEAIGTAPLASQNQYTLSANYSLPILYENGPIQPSSITTAGNITGLNDYANGGMFSAHYLPRTAGVAVTLGDVGGVTLIGNLTTQVNLYAKGGVFTDSIQPFTAGRQLTFDGTGGAVFAGPVVTPWVDHAAFTAPTTSTTACTPGETADGTVSGISYHYFCYATNHWGRVALTTTGW